VKTVRVLQSNNCRYSGSVKYVAVLLFCSVDVCDRCLTPPAWSVRSHLHIVVEILIPQLNISVVTRICHRI
jgi:hypothetical protein